MSGILDDVMADLAYHWGEAGTSTVDDVAFTYARRAADLAMEQASPDEAARWFRIARERLDGADPAVDADLLLQLGLAESALGASGLAADTDRRGPGRDGCLAICALRPTHSPTPSASPSRRRR